MTFSRRSAFMALVILVIAAVSKTSLKTRHPGFSVSGFSATSPALCVNIMSQKNFSICRSSLSDARLHRSALCRCVWDSARGPSEALPGPGAALHDRGWLYRCCSVRPGSGSRSSPLAFIALGLFFGLCSAATGLTSETWSLLGEPIIRTVAVRNRVPHDRDRQSLLHGITRCLSYQTCDARDRTDGRKPAQRAPDSGLGTRKTASRRPSVLRGAVCLRAPRIRRSRPDTPQALTWAGSRLCSTAAGSASVSSVPAKDTSPPSFTTTPL